MIPTDEKEKLIEMVEILADTKTLLDSEYREILAAHGKGKIISTQIISLLHLLIRGDVLR